MDLSTSNYEKNCQEWQARFCAMDQERLLSIIPGLRREGGDLTLYHFGEKFAVDAATGAIRSLETAEPVAFRQGILNPFVATFTGHRDALAHALEAMGGQRVPCSDVGYQVDAFACIPVRYLFWEGDEEFPAQANMLFDRSATDFIHGESIVSIAMAGLYRLAQLSGLPLARGAFPMP